VAHSGSASSSTECDCLGYAPDHLDLSPGSSVVATSSAQSVLNIRLLDPIVVCFDQRLLPMALYSMTRSSLLIFQKPMNLQICKRR
jgi:hypothetical protein